MGLARYAITHWVTVSNFMELTPIPTIWVYLGASGYRALVESLKVLKKVKISGRKVQIIVMMGT